MRKKLPVDNLAYAVLVSFDNDKSTGSGFRLKHKNQNYLITAKHVLYNDDEKLWGDSLTVLCQTPEPGIDDITTFRIHLSRAIIYCSRKSDVAAILLGENIKLYADETPLKDLEDDIKRPTMLKAKDYIEPILLGKRGVSVDREATRSINDIQIANDVYLMGYPISLGIQKNNFFDYTKPLLRKGIIAGINLKENNFIIDCPAYPGNSGGPIIEDSEDEYFRVIGLVSKYIPYEIKWYNNREKIINTELANSGYSVCVPMNVVFELLDSI